MKLVTVGIPFFNNQTSLKYAVKSVQNQTYKHLEIILIDDGSKDQSLLIAQSIAAEDSRVRVITHGKNSGLISRLNQIIELASGYYLARMDADDIIHPEKIEKQIKVFEEDSSIDVVTTGMVSLNKNLHPTGIRYCNHKYPVVKDVFKNGHGILHASMMARIVWWKQNKYIQGFERAEDRELFTRTLKSSQYYNIPEPLYYYVDAPNMTLKKFIVSYSSERKAIIKNWRGNISRIYLSYLVARCLLKQLVVRVLFLLKRQETIFQSKNISLKNHETNVIQKTIRDITS